MVNLKSKAVFLIDEDGNPVGVVLDGAVYRLQTETKLAAGTSVVGRVGIDSAQTGGLALETTLDAARLVLAAIRDTAGIKKITDVVATSSAVGSQVDGHSATIGATADADTVNTVIGRLKKVVGLLAGGLPSALTGGGSLKTAIVEAIAAGSNEIGKVAQGAAAALSGAWPIKITDGINVLGTDSDPLVARTGVVVSSLNSSTSPLGAGAEFVGAVENITKFQEIDVNLAGAPTVAPGTFYFEFSPDGVVWDVSVPIVLDGPSMVPQFLRVVLPFFRVRYVNGATPLTEFRLTTVYHYHGSIRLTRFLNQAIDPDIEPVENVRAAIMGRRPDGSFGNVSISANDFLNVARDALFYAGTVTATGVVSTIDVVNVSGLSLGVLQVQGTFVAVIQVEGTNDPTAAPGDAPGTKGWSTIQLISESSGARSTSTKNAGRFLVLNLPRFLRVRCTAYTSGTATINLMLKPALEQNPARFITDQDGLSRWALTTFGTGIVTQKTFLTGADFDTPSGLDPDQWSSLHGGSGSKVFANGLLELKTGVTADSFEGVQSQRVANFLGGADNQVLIVAKFGDTGTANNVKRFGVYDDNDGVFIEQNSTGITVKTRKNGVDSESPFGLLGVVNPTNNTAFSFWEITFTPAFIIVRQNGNFITLFVGSSSLDSLFSRYDLPVRAENRNIGGGSSDTSLFVQTLVANRLGQPQAVRADEPFEADDVLQATAAVIQGRQPDGGFVPQRTQGRHTPNCSTALLDGDTGVGEAHIFRGAWFEWQNSFGALVVDATSDVSGTLFIDFSQAPEPTNGVDTDVDESIEIPYNPVINPLLRRTAQLQSRWVRIRYVNGNVGQMRFNLDAAFLPWPIHGSQPASIPPNFKSLTGMVQAIMTAEDGIPGPSGHGDLNHVKTTESASGKKGLNTHLTGLDAPFDLRALRTYKTGQLLVNAESPVQIPPPDNMDPSEVKGISISNSDTDTDVLWGNEFVSPITGDFIFARGAKDIALDSYEPIFLISDGEGGVTAEGDRFSPTTANNNGVVNPGNLGADDGTYAILDSLTDSVQLDGFTPAGAQPNVQSISLNLKGRKAASPTTETVAHVATVTAVAANVTSVASPTVTAVAGQFYLVAISRRNTGAAVTSVSGLGLSWTEVVDHSGDAGQARISVWRGIGTPTGNGVVTATFSQGTTNVVIGVSRFSGVNLSTPVENSEFLDPAGTASSYSDSIVGTDKGLVYVAVSHRSETHTPGSGATEQADVRTGTGNSDAALAITTLGLLATGAQAYSGTVSAAVDLPVIALSLRPASAVNPTLLVTYQVGGDPGLTTLAAILDSTTAETFTVDLTGDRNWTSAHITALVATLSVTAIGAAAAEVDAIWLHVVEVEDGATARISYAWVGEPTP